MKHSFSGGIFGRRFQIQVLIRRLKGSFQVIGGNWHKMLLMVQWQCFRFSIH